MVILLTGCGPEDDRRAIPEDCGLPTPVPGLEAGFVPPELVIEGAEISGAQERDDGYSATINLPYSVTDAFPLIKDALTDAGFEIVGEDFEGFEAEIYARAGDLVGGVQIRRSVCEDRSLGLVNMTETGTQE